MPFRQRDRFHLIRGHTDAPRRETDFHFRFARRQAASEGWCQQCCAHGRVEGAREELSTRMEIAANFTSGVHDGILTPVWPRSRLKSLPFAKLQPPMDTDARWQRDEACAISF